MGYICRQARYGRMLYNPKDKYVGRSFHLYGEFSEGEVEFFRDELRGKEKEALTIDVGANIGAHTLFFAKHSNAVMAFEPQRLIFQMMCANMANNDILNAITFHAALGEKFGYVKVPVLDPEQENNFGGLYVDGHEDGENVFVFKLDDVGPPRVDLMKIDVEGMERQVLKGALETIKRCSPVLYVENDRAEKQQALLEFIEDNLAYTWETHLTKLYNPNNFAENKDNVFGEIVSGNVICYPKNLPPKRGRIVVP